MKAFSKVTVAANMAFALLYSCSIDDCKGNKTDKVFLGDNLTPEQCEEAAKRCEGEGLYAPETGSCICNVHICEEQQESRSSTFSHRSKI